MKALTLIIAIAATMAMGCSAKQGMNEANGGGAAAGSVDAILASVCQKGTECCTSAELICPPEGPDSAGGCACYKAWDCVVVLSTIKCTQAGGSKPDANGGWECVVSNGQDICTRNDSDVPNGGENTVPDGSNGWVCVDQGDKVVCTRDVNEPGNPSNGGGGSSSGDNGGDSSGNNGGSSGGSSGSGGSSSSGGNSSGSNGSSTPSGGIDWSCRYDEFGNKECTAVPTTPNGGNNGTTPGTGTSTTPGGDTPTTPGGGDDTVPNPGTGTGTTLTPKPGEECVPGQKRWCDGANYCSWGIKKCLPNGMWEKSCYEVSDGSRPNTECACFHFYYNPQCCETPDCIVPSTGGQICKPSAGAYCDYCNPQKPECTAGKCVVSKTGNVYDDDLGRNMDTYENFCGKNCSSNSDCPANSTCKVADINLGNSSAKQCVPNTNSCFKK